MPFRRAVLLGVSLGASVTLALAGQASAAIWLDPVPVTDRTARGTGMVTLGASTVIVAYDTLDAGLQIRRSTDGGATWKPPVTLVGGPVHGGARIAGLGRSVDALWREGEEDVIAQLVYRRSTDRGQSFGARSVLATTDWPSEILDYEVARGPDGVVAVLWTEIEYCFSEDQCDHRILYRIRVSTDGGSAFGPAATVATALGGYVSEEAVLSDVAVGDGVIHVAFMKSLELRLKRSYTAGATWSKPKVLSTRAKTDEFSATLALVATGESATVAYVDWSSPRLESLLVRHTFDAGAHWSGPVVLSSVERRIVSDLHLTRQGGTLRIAFARCPFDCVFPGGYRMFYRASPDGTTWTPTQLVLEHRVPSAIGFAGQVQILYDDYLGDPLRPFVIRGAAT